MGFTMQLISIYYIFFVLISIFLFYITPKALQKYVLFLASVIFLACANNAYLNAFVIITIIATFISYKGIKGSRKGGWLAFGIITNLSLLFAFKYLNFFLNNANSLLSLFTDFSIPVYKFVAPLGISFYSLQVIGYLLDTYWGKIDSSVSFLLNALFITYFPQMTSGPISRFEELGSQLLEKHKIDLKCIKQGLIRILWGFFKKIVISARLAVIVDTIYSDTNWYSGMYVWIAAILFVFQLYTDFSGCMDIISGTSLCYGIRLPENFRTPFFSKTVQEFWQRWHITLGAWMRDYVMFPIMYSNRWKTFSKNMKAKFGKRNAQFISSFSAMLLIWLLIGLWHGGDWKYVIGMGVWFWTCIVLEQMCSSLKLFDQTAISHSKLKNVLVYAKVLILVAIGNIFFRMNSLSDSFFTILDGFKNTRLSHFYHNELLLGLNIRDSVILMIGMIVGFFVATVQEKKGSFFIYFDSQNFLKKTLIIYALVFSIIIFGKYGSNVDASKFIYQGF